MVGEWWYCGIHGGGPYTEVFGELGGELLYVGM